LPIWGHFFDIAGNTKDLLHALSDGHRPSRPIEDTSPVRDEVGIIISPGRTRCEVQSFTLLKSDLGVGIWVDEDVQVITCCHRFGVPGPTQPLTNDVTRPIGQTDYREGFGFYVHTPRDKV